MAVSVKQIPAKKEVFFAYTTPAGDDEAFTPAPPQIAKQKAPEIASEAVCSVLFPVSVRQTNSGISFCSVTFTSPNVVIFISGITGRLTNARFMNGSIPSA